MTDIARHPRKPEYVEAILHLDDASDHVCQGAVTVATSTSATEAGGDGRYF
jgi:hypothetical protein